MKWYRGMAAALLLALGINAAGMFTEVAASEMTAMEDRGAGWMLRVRGIGILPDTDADLNLGPSYGLDIDDRIIPELDITYFLTKNIALELVLAVSKHDVTGTGTIAGTDVGDFYIIPPHLMLQYHFDMGNGIKPYVGAGVNYNIILGEDDAAGFSGLDIDNGWGFSLQAGVDIHLRDKWYFNIDVKKTWMNVDATTVLTSGPTPVSADIDVDPWIVGVGIGYRF